LKDESPAPPRETLQLPFSSSFSFGNSSLGQQADPVRGDLLFSLMCVLFFFYSRSWEEVHDVFFLSELSPPSKLPFFTTLKEKFDPLPPLSLSLLEIKKKGVLDSRPY